MIPRYTAESLPLSATLARGSKGLFVKRAQELLALAGFATAPDGDFGPATERVVQLYAGSSVKTIDAALYARLLEPLTNVDNFVAGAATFGDRVVQVCQQHLQWHPREVGGDNRGIWVRRYGFGRDQSNSGFFPWCQVFASSMWHDAALGGSTPFAIFDVNGVMSAYVPWVVQQARSTGKFITAEARKNIKPGSMFFVRGNVEGIASHIHVGIVIAWHGDTFETVEGNTNHDGSSNGYEVARRVRSVGYCDFGTV